MQKSTLVENSQIATPLVIVLLIVIVATITPRKIGRVIGLLEEIRDNTRKQN